jgi:hypothetical protein
MIDTILIGNGTSVLDCEKGGAIDMCKNVVRFNYCRIKGYEKHVGTKTNEWWTVTRCNERLMGNLRPLDAIIFHSWERSPEKDKLWETYKHLPHASKASHDMIREINAYAEETSYKAWSTGVLAIWHHLKRRPLVVLHGFDWWERDKHHYGDQALRGTLHKPWIERGLIEKLISQGKVQML